MSDDKKPREFWLGNEYVDVKGHGKYYSWKRVNPEHPSDVHVIEHSAYAALQKENEELQAELENKRGTMALEIHRLMKENTELKSALLGDCEAEHVKVEKENASLRESLKEMISFLMQLQTTPWPHDCTVDVAAADLLAKIKANHGEL